MIEILEFKSAGQKIIGHYMGQVIENLDPEGKGRIKVRVPMLLDPVSDWIRPYGVWDGSNGRGLFMVPKKEANVMLVFLQVDGSKQTNIRWVAGNWGARGGAPEVPSESQLGNPDIVVMAFDGFAIVIDETDGQRKATFKERASGGSYFQFDIETGELKIFGKQNKDEQITGNVTEQVGGNKDETVTGNLTVTVQGNADVNVTGNAEVKATGTMLIDGAPEIKLGSGVADALAKKTGLKLHIDTHFHQVGGVMPGTGTLPTTPPTVTTPDTAFTTKTKGE